MKRVRRWISARPETFKRWDQAAKLAHCPTWQRWARLVLMHAASIELEHAASKLKRSKSR